MNMSQNKGNTDTKGDNHLAKVEIRNKEIRIFGNKEQSNSLGDLATAKTDSNIKVDVFCHEDSIQSKNSLASRKAK